MLVSELIERIIEKSGAVPLEASKTCDHIIIGSGDVEVKKVATTFMATVEVIRKAAALGVNFIITHEPTWFTGNDKTDWTESDCVYREKKKLIEENGITIWRFHDHMHMGQEDGIYRGFNLELGWAEYRIPDVDGLNHFGECYQIPKISLEELTRCLKKTLGMDTIQIVGDPRMMVERIGVLVGGGGLGLGVEERPMQLMEKAQLDLLICGEILEWTVTAYVRDAAALGMNRAMLVLGHERTEEAGMKHLAPWLKDIADGVEVCFIDAKEPFVYL